MFKLSAEDIVNQSFQRCFRGYDPDQVEEFLMVVAREWEHMRSELERAKTELAERSEELDEYREREETLQESLEMAKRVSDEIKEEAERKAELKLADAEIEADRILSSVEDEVQALREDIYQLKQQRRRYAAELRSLLTSHLEILERMEEEPSYEERIPRAPRPVVSEEAGGPIEEDADAEARENTSENANDVKDDGKGGEGDDETDDCGADAAEDAIPIEGREADTMH